MTEQDTGAEVPPGMGAMLGMFQGSDWGCAMLSGCIVWVRRGSPFDAMDAVTMQDPRLSYAQASLEFLADMLVSPRTDGAMVPSVNGIPPGSTPVLMSIGPDGSGAMVLTVALWQPDREGVGAVGQWWTAYSACPACGYSVGEWGETCAP